MAPYKHLSRIFEVSVFWYNPNIHPYREFLRRLRSVRDFCSKYDISLVEDLSYPIEDWLLKASLLSKKSNVLRCRFCYGDRLYKTALVAKELGFDLFSTTLLLAPYQKHELVKEIGFKVSDKVGIDFYYEDMRKWFKESEDMAKMEGVYRQGYCGCVFSEVDRYWRENL